MAEGVTLFLGHACVHPSNGFNNERLQAAIDSPHPVWILPGVYRMSGETIRINRAKSITCLGHALMTGAAKHNWRGPNLIPRGGEQVRFVATENAPMFQFNQQQVFWSGGCFDSQDVPDYDSAFMYLPLDWIHENHNLAPLPQGWGMAIEGVIFQGADTYKANGIFVDFEGPNRRNAFLTHARFQATASGMDTVFRMNDRVEGSGHWANNIEIDVECVGVRRSVVCLPAGGCDIRIRHQGATVFDSEDERDSTASATLRDDGHHLDVRFFDFGTKASLGKYQNRVPFDLEGSVCTIKEMPPNHLPSVHGDYVLPKMPVARPHEFLDVNHWVNQTANKDRGFVVWDRNNLRPLWARSSGESNVWVDSAGTIVYQPEQPE